MLAFTFSLMLFHAVRGGTRADVRTFSFVIPDLSRVTIEEETDFRPLPPQFTMRA